MKSRQEFDNLLERARYKNTRFLELGHKMGDFEFMGRTNGIKFDSWTSMCEECGCIFVFFDDSKEVTFGNPVRNPATARYERIEKTTTCVDIQVKDVVE